MDQADIKQDRQRRAARVLLIEDEARIRDNLEVLLSNSGYSVTSAATGVAGLEFAQQPGIDLVVTDLVMQGFEAFELLDQLRAGASCVPIVVITGNTSTLSAREAMRRGANAYLAKPFSIGALRATISQLLDAGVNS